MLVRWLGEKGMVGGGEGRKEKERKITDAIVAK